MESDNQNLNHPCKGKRKEKKVSNNSIKKQYFFPIDTVGFKKKAQSKWNVLWIPRERSCRNENIAPKRLLQHSTF